MDDGYILPAWSAGKYAGKCVDKRGLPNTAQENTAPNTAKKNFGLPPPPPNQKVRYMYDSTVTPFMQIRYVSM